MLTTRTVSINSHDHLKISSSYSIRTPELVSKVFFIVVKSLKVKLLCDILDNYRTIVEEYCKVADVLLWILL